MLSSLFIFFSSSHEQGMYFLMCRYWKVKKNIFYAGGLDIQHLARRQSDKR